MVPRIIQAINWQTYVKKAVLNPF